MKKLITSLLLATGLVASTHAAHLGASAGYLIDSEEAYFTVRGGLTLKATSAVLHQAEIELGYTDQSEGSLKSSIIPLTANYRAEFVNAGKFSPFVGFGAGAAEVEIDTWFGDGSDTVLALQAFAGVSYKATETVSLNIAARYLWIDSVDLLGVNNIEVGDDVALELGVSIKF